MYEYEVLPGKKNAEINIVLENTASLLSVMKYKTKQEKKVKSPNMMNEHVNGLIMCWIYNHPNLKMSSELR